MSSKERFVKALQELCEICSKEGWGDPLNYGRSREIDMAIKLGHTISDTLAGADAYNENGEPVEYKTTIGNVINGTYNGISVYSSWEEQERYLREEKIGKYKEHYFTRYVGATIVECWKLTNEQVLDYILPRLKKKYELITHKKDPRLGINIPKKIIYGGKYIKI